ncbi:unnamed protein product [Rhodiola kirilowii]
MISPILQPLSSQNDLADFAAFIRHTWLWRSHSIYAFRKACSTYLLREKIQRKYTLLILIENLYLSSLAPAECGRLDPLEVDIQESPHGSFTKVMSLTFLYGFLMSTCLRACFRGI